MQKLCLFACLLLFILSSSSCGDDLDENFTANGVRPVYIQPEEANVVASLAPQPIGQLGKIYYKDNLIYVGERGEGVHIIDNNDPFSPERIGFIRIPGNIDIAIKGNYLYADNYRDLITLDISDINAIAEISRVADVYPEMPQSHPYFYSGYFECVDPSKGFVMKWEPALLNNPACYR